MPRRRMKPIPSRYEAPRRDVNYPEEPGTWDDAVASAEHLEREIENQQGQARVVGGHRYVTIAEISLRRIIDILRLPPAKRERQGYRGDGQ